MDVFCGPVGVSYSGKWLRSGGCSPLYDNSTVNNFTSCFGQSFTDAALVRSIPQFDVTQMIIYNDFSKPISVPISSQNVKIRAVMLNFVT